MSFPLMPLIPPTSNLGVDWSSVGGLATSVNLRQLSVSPAGQWVAVRSDSVTSILRSTSDGSGWSSVTVPLAGITGGFRGSAYGSGLFVITENDDQIHSSPDGLTWTRRVAATRDLRRATFNDGYFVVGSEVSGAEAIYASANGTSWTFNPQGSFGGTASAASCGIYVSSLNRTFAAGSQYRYVNAIPTSATAWTGTPTGIGGIVNDVAWSPTAAIAVAMSSNGIYSSADMITWSLRAATANMYGVAWCGDQFVAVGSLGKIFTSLNGTTWTARTSGTSNDLYGVARQGNTILAVGSLGTVLRSS
jgi:hypothetical protein